MSERIEQETLPDVSVNGRPTFGNQNQNEVQPVSGLGNIGNKQLGMPGITLVNGTIGGWRIADQQISSGSVSISAVNQLMLFGAATAPLTGTGIYLGLDGGSAYDFRAGNPAGQYIHWDGSAGTLTVSGALIAGEIHIPDRDTTANSFHVNTGGNMWIGATETNFNALNQNAQVYFLNTGAGFTRTTLQVGLSTGNFITIDGANLRIRSSTYVTGVSGFTVEPTLVEAENLLARGMMRGSVFQFDIISSVGGQVMVANSDTLSTDMTALDASTLTIRGLSATLAVNDILVMRATTALGIQEEWLRVTAIGAAPTYTVTRDLAGSFAADTNPIWQAGTPVVKQGVSDGAAAFSGGWLRLFGEGTNSPYYSVYQRTGVAYNAFTERVRMGNLNGYLDYVADIFGFGVGSSVAGEANITFDPTNGIRIRQGTTNLITMDMAGTATLLNLTVGGSLNILTSGNIRSGQTAYNTGTGFFLEYNAGTPRFSIGDGGVSQYLTWDGVTLTVNGRTFGSEPTFGDGSDGAVTIAADTTLTRDMFYSTLTVNAGFILTTDGYRIFCTGTVTVNGTIQHNGNAGVVGTVGAAGANGPAGAGGAGGAGGAAATALSNTRSLFGNLTNQAGGTGGDGAAAGGNGANSAAGAAGTASTASVAAVNGAAGGVGGTAGTGGGGGAGGGAGSGGAAGAGGTAAESGTKPRASATAVLMIDTRSTVVQLQGPANTGVSSGGGGGGSARQFVT